MGEPATIRVLLVEDNPGDARLLREALAAGAPARFEVVHADSLAQAAPHLSAQGFDVMLLDLSLPDSIGLQTVTGARRLGPGVPIVVLTGADDEALGLEVIRHGAQDYLVKGQADPRTMARAIRYAMQRWQTEQRLRAAVEELTAAKEHREQHLQRHERLIEVSADVLAETSVEGLLERVVDAARTLTGARIGVSGHGFHEGQFRVGRASRAQDALPCPKGELFRTERGGVYMALLERQATIRLTDSQLRSHPLWKGPPAGHAPLRGLLGARLTDAAGRAVGLIMVSDRADGGQFSDEDEVLLGQLAALASLGLQHIESRRQAQRLIHELGGERARLKAVFDSTPEAIVVADDQGRLLMANRVAEELYARPIPYGDDLDSHARMQICYPDGTPCPPRELPLTLAALDGQVCRNMELAIVWPDGQRRDLLANCAPVSDRQGHRTGAVGVFQDITDRKQTERDRLALLEALQRARDELEVRVWQRTAELSQAVNALQGEVVERTQMQEMLRKTNKALRMHVECNQALVRARDEHELLQSVCQIIADVGGYRLAWVGLAEQDQDRTIRVLAHAGPAEGYLRQIRLSWADTPRGRGPSGRSIRSGEPVICRDVDSDVLFKPWRENARRHGLGSTISIPLHDGLGQPFGMLAIYAAQPDAFDEQEVALLCDVAGDLMFGLQALQAQQSRRQAEHALRESEHRFRQMAEVVPEVFWILSTDTGQLLYVSPMYERISGRPAEEVSRAPGTWLRMIHPDDAMRARRLASQLRSWPADRPCLEGELRIIRPDGAVRLLQIQSFPVRNDAGRVYRVCGVAQDITERRHAEQARLRLAAIVEHSDDAILSMDLHGVIQSWNAAAQRMYGYAAEDILGRSVTLLAPEDRRPEIHRMLRGARRGRSMEHYETVRLRRDGAQFHAAVTVSPIRGMDGSVVAISSVSRDITERKRLEREVLEIGEMERRRIGQDLHDTLGQNLTGVAILAKVLQQKLRAQGCPDAAVQVENLAQHVNEAIGMTRTLARGLCPLEFKADGLLAALEELAERTAAMAGIACRFESQGAVVVDDTGTAMHLYHIAQEAVNNALKHAQAAGILVRLAESRDKLVLTVRDDGVGLPDPLPTGSGLGLRILEYRARMIGATMEVRRHSRGGTLVRCVMPAPRRAARDEDAARPVLPAPPA